jgi:hypothetical protein
MEIVISHDPKFMSRVRDQTEVTLREALYHHPRTRKLGAEVEAALAALGQRGNTNG